MGLQERAARLAAGETTIHGELASFASTSERCGLALVADRPDLIPEPWTGSIEGAWGRLDDRQRTIVRQHAPDIDARLQEAREVARNAHAWAAREAELLAASREKPDDELGDQDRRR